MGDLDSDKPCYVRWWQDRASPTATMAETVNVGRRALDNTFAGSLRRAQILQNIPITHVYGQLGLPDFVGLAILQEYGLGDSDDDSVGELWDALER